MHEWAVVGKHSLGPLQGKIFRPNCRNNWVFRQLWCSFLTWTFDYSKKIAPPSARQLNPLNEGKSCPHNHIEGSNVLMKLSYIKSYSRATRVIWVIELKSLDLSFCSLQSFNSRVRTLVLKLLLQRDQATKV